MTVNHGVLGSSPCSGADARGLRRVLSKRVLEGWRRRRKPEVERIRQSQAILRELSSAGSEHLPYKQRVGGSNPSAPTEKQHDRQSHSNEWLLLYVCMAQTRLQTYTCATKVGASRTFVCRGTSFGSRGKNKRRDTAVGGAKSIPQLPPVKIADKIFIEEDLSSDSSRNIALFAYKHKNPAFLGGVFVLSYQDSNLE